MGGGVGWGRARILESKLAPNIETEVAGKKLQSLSETFFKQIFFKIHCILKYLTGICMYERWSINIAIISACNYKI